MEKESKDAGHEGFSSRNHGQPQASKDELGLCKDVAQCHGQTPAHLAPMHHSMRRAEAPLLSDTPGPHASSHTVVPFLQQVHETEQLDIDSRAELCFVLSTPSLLSASLAKVFVQAFGTADANEKRT